MPPSSVPPELSIVYVLTNPAMPGLVKIGKTSRKDANERIAELYTTGVPVPFEIEFACKVPNPKEVEDALHTAFDPDCINPSREFFRIDPEQAIAILKLFHTEDATHEIKQEPANLDQQSIAAGKQLKSKRPKMNFVEMGIPIGSILQFTYGQTTVTVVGPKKVQLAEETPSSLAPVTSKLLGLQYSVRPGRYWTFGGKKLSDIWEDTYGDAE